MNKKIIGLTLTFMMILSAVFINPVFAAENGVRDPFSPIFLAEYDEIIGADAKVEETQIYNLWGRTLVFKNIDFNVSPSTVSFESARSGEGTNNVQIRLDSPDGILLATFDEVNTNGWTSWKNQTKRLDCEFTGIHDIYVVFSSLYSSHVRNMQFGEPSKEMLRMPTAKKDKLFSDIDDKNFEEIADVLISLELAEETEPGKFGSNNNFTIKEAFMAASKMAGYDYDYMKRMQLSDAEFFDIFRYDVGYNFHRMVETDPITVKDMAGLMVGVLGWLDVVKEMETDVVTLAHKLKLFNGLENKDLKALISKKDAAMLIYNAMNAQSLAVSAYTADGAIYEKSDSRGILAATQNIFKAQGVVNKNCLTSAFSSATNLNIETVEIDGVKFNTGSSGIACAIGMNVDFYYQYNEDDKSMTVLWYKICEDEILTIDNEHLIEITANTIKYDDGKKIKSVSFASNIDVIYNEVYASAYSSVKSLVGDITKFKGSLTLINNDNDDAYDLIKIESFKSYVLNSFSDVNGILVHQYSDTPLNLKQNDITGSVADEFLYTAYTVNGIITDARTYPSGTIVDVAKSVNSSGPIYSKIIFNDNVVSGEINSIINSDNLVVIDNVEYGISNEFKAAVNASKVSNFEIGNEGRYFINSFGEIVFFESVSKFVSIINAYGLTTDKFDKALKIKLFTNDGKMITTQLADKVIVDGNTYTDMDLVKTHLDNFNIPDVLSKTDTTNGNKTYTDITDIKGTVAGYRMNSKKEITMLDTLKPGDNTQPDYESDYDSLTVIKKAESGDRFYAESVTISGDLGWGGGVIFNIPSSDSSDFNKDEKFTIADKLPTSDAIFTAYSTNNDAIISDVLVLNGGSIGSTSNRLLVDRLSNVLDEDGEVTVQVKGYLFGYSSCKPVTLLFDRTDYPATISGVIEKGDIINVRYDRDGRIVNCLGNVGLATGVESSNIMYKADGTKVDETKYLNDTAKLNTGNTTIDITKLAEIDKVNGNFIYFKQRLNTETWDSISGPNSLTAFNTPKVYVYDGRLLTEGTMADVFNGAKVLMNTYYNEAKVIIVYQNQ